MVTLSEDGKWMWNDETKEWIPAPPNSNPKPVSNKEIKNKIIQKNNYEVSNEKLTLFGNLSNFMIYLLGAICALSVTFSAILTSASFRSSAEDCATSTYNANVNCSWISSITIISIILFIFSIAMSKPIYSEIKKRESQNNNIKQLYTIVFVVGAIIIIGILSVLYLSLQDI